MDERDNKVGLETRLKQLKEFFIEAGFTTTRAKVSYILLGISIIIYVVSRIFSPFAEFWTRHVSSVFRCVLGSVTSIFHFSIAECAIVCIPAVVILLFAHIAIADKYAETLRDSYKNVVTLLTVLCILLSMFLGTFGPCYFRSPLEENLGLNKEKVSAEELYNTALKVSALLDAEAENVQFVFQGESVMPYSYDELVEKINAAYTSYCADADYIRHFYSYPKPIALSEAMTFTHISGVYTYITGESNINTNYPDFILPYTMAHEMAHQRGIAPEDAANFVAYLVCIQSDDAYVRYSAYLNMYNYLRNALYVADKKLFSELNAVTKSEIVGELNAYSKMFNKFSNSTAANISQTINNIYLGSQGQSQGVASYGLVVDLAVAYYNN